MEFRIRANCYINKPGGNGVEPVCRAGRRVHRERDHPVILTGHIAVAHPRAEHLPLFRGEAGDLAEEVVQGLPLGIKQHHRVAPDEVLPGEDFAQGQGLAGAAGAEDRQGATNSIRQCNEPRRRSRGTGRRRPGHTRGRAAARGRRGGRPSLLVEQRRAHEKSSSAVPMTDPLTSRPRRRGGGASVWSMIRTGGGSSSGTPLARLSLRSLFRIMIMA